MRDGHESEAAGPTAVRVVYGDPQPNGLASMLGGLIEANLAAHPERARLLEKRATFAIRAPDVDVAVSIRLTPGLVTVRNGVVGRPDILVEADSETLIGLSSVPLRFGLPDVATKEGRAVNRKIFNGRLKVKGLLRHPAKLARLNSLMTVG
ncbi:MAG TPA: hypothetical protein VF972_09135 [Actinomycetota bacterium]